MRTSTDYSRSRTSDTKSPWIAGTRRGIESIIMFFFALPLWALIISDHEH